MENCYEFSKRRLDLGFKVRVRVGVSSGRFPLTITSNGCLQSLSKDHVNVNRNKTRIPWLHSFSDSETVLRGFGFKNLSNSKRDVETNNEESVKTRGQRPGY